MGQVSFMLDTWSGQRYQLYLAITAYWITDIKGVLQLKTALIAFHHLCQNHTGKLMARAVRHLLDRAGVTMKVRWLCSFSH
jgi:hypothetical protein